MKRYMDLTGNIIEMPEKVKREEKVQEKVEKEKQVEEEERLEQELANIHMDDEDIELKETTCPMDKENIFECPMLVIHEEDDPELKDQIVECGICGRFDWKKKESLL